MGLKIFLAGLVGLLLLVSQSSLSQSLTNTSMGYSAGYLKTNSGVSLTYSGGEAVTGIFSNTEVSFTAPIIATSNITPTFIELPVEIPGNITLYQNYPNPFNPNTIIPFSLHQSSEVKIKVFNVLGSLISEYNLGLRSAGQHNLEVNASSWSSGVYIYALVVDGMIYTSRKLILIK